MKIVLPSGATGFTNDSGHWICTGSQFGRRDVVAAAPGKLRLQKLPFVDDCYDRWGAYWGAPETIWIAFSDPRWEVELQGFNRVATRVMKFRTALFVRANTRAEAKMLVRSTLPNAIFYR